MSSLNLSCIYGSVLSAVPSQVVWERENLAELLAERREMRQILKSERANYRDLIVGRIHDLTRRIYLCKINIHNITVRRQATNDRLIKIFKNGNYLSYNLDGIPQHEVVLCTERQYSLNCIKKFYDSAQEGLKKEFYSNYKREHISLYNRFALLGIDEEDSEGESWFEDEPEIDLELIHTRCRIHSGQIKGVFDHLDYSDYTPPEEDFELVRNQNLLEKLDFIISKFEEFRKKKGVVGFEILAIRHRVKNLFGYIKSLLVDDPVEAESIEMEDRYANIKEYHEMPEDPSKSVYDPIVGALAHLEFAAEAQMEKESKEGDCNVIKEDQKENVVLTSHSEESVAKPITIGVDNWEKLCSSQAYQAYDIMQRWKKYTTLVWSKDKLQNESLWNVPLPSDFIKQTKDSPNSILFKTYSYCRFDMEVKIQINSNKFHAGQLQASFYYGASSDKYYKDRANIACASQMTHCVIDAASASDGLLLIPFRYYKPLLATRKVLDDDDILNIGSLRLFVLNPLMVPDNDTSTVDVSVFFRFVNPRFHGMIDRSLGTFVTNDFEFVEAQMLSVSGLKGVVKSVDSLLNNVFPDEERDNPTDPTPPNVINPQNTQSWCVGDILPERLNVLRLQGDGVTPHPPGTLPDEPEMRLSYIQQIYGLCSTIKWQASDKSGSILLKIPFSPILASSDYFSYTINNGEQRSCEVMPPVAVLASMFAYWRGSLDYKIDFICNQFHTGRLLVAYVPRITLTVEPTLEQLSCCDHIIMDIRSNKQYQFINRFLSDKPWWPRRKADSNSSESYPPGYIYFVVLNQLTAPPSVAQSIEFNLYMRGASDFELHIPVAPHIGLSSNTQIIKRNIRIESYVSTYGPPQEQIYVGSWHTLAGKTGYPVAMFRYGPGSDHVTQFTPPKGKVNAVYRIVGSPDDIKFINSANKVVSATYMVLVPPIYELNSTQYWYGLAFNSPSVAAKYANSIKEDPKNVGFYTVDYSKMSRSGGEADYSPRNDVIYWETIEKVEAQMEDERKFVCGDQVSIHPPVQSTWNGLLTFGEQITNVKQLIRRYQPYGACTLPQNKNDPTLADVKIPLLPQGLDLDLGLDYCNQNREGLIPLLLSGYRFFRGGMRLRIMVSDNSKNSKHIWVQHKCDEKLALLKMDTQLDSSVVNNRMTSGYASYLQNLDTNSIVSIEIPFYLPGQFGLLQRPDLIKKQDSPHYSLGNLYVGVDYGAKSGTQNLSAQLVTFYSLSDDFHASVFQGFPPVFRVTDFQVEAQMEEEKASTSWNPLTSLRNKFSQSAINVANKVLEDKKDDIINKLKDDFCLEQFLKSVTDSMDEGKKMVVMAALSNVFHSIINPSFSTLAWSLASFLLTLGIISFNVVQSVFEYFKRTVTRLFSKQKNSIDPRCETDDSGIVESQSPGEYDDAAFVSTCVAGALVLMKAKDMPLPTSIPNFSKFIYEGIPKFTLSANGLFAFFKNNLNMLRRIFKWVISYVRPEACLYNEIEDGETDILAYVKQIQWCLDAQNERRIQTELQAQLQVYLCANVAQILLAKMSVSKIEKPMPVFTRYLYKIVELRDKLAREFASPPVRYEPFVIGLVGPSKIGKSHMCNRLASELISSIGYKSFEELVYVRTPGNPYWNNLYNQPVCVYDDFLCLQDQQFGLMQVAELFCLKSTATFNPTKAAIEEKNLRYNPLLVILCSNIAFPKVAGVTCDEALHRRRDILIHAQLKKKYVGCDPRSIDSKVVADYGHLEFRIYSDSTKIGFIMENGADKVFSYAELNSFLIKKHQFYHEKECAQYRKRLLDLQKHFPTIINTSDSISENMEKIEEWISKKFGESVSVTSVQQNIMMGGSQTPVLQKIAKEKEKFVQPKHGVYGVEMPNNAELVQAQVHAEIEVVAQSGDEELSCKCLEHDFKMVNNLANGDVCLISEEDMFILGKCSESCLFDKVTDSKALLSFANVVKAKWLSLDRPLDKLPSSIRLHLGISKTAENYLQQINGEIKESVVWYKRWLENLPGFFSILKFLGKFLALIGGLFAVTRGLSALFNMPKHIEADVNKANADRDYSAATAYDAENVNKTIVKLWNNDTEFMESSVKKMFVSGNEDQMPSSGSSATVGAPKGNKALVKSFVTGQSEMELHDVVYHKIKRNTFWLRAECLSASGIVSGSNLRCLGLGGRYALLIDHYYHYIKRKIMEGGKLYFITSNVQIQIKLSDISVTTSKNSALYLIQLPLQIPAFSNIIKFIASSHHHANLSPLATLVEPVYNINRNTIDLNMHKFSRISKQDKLVVNNDDSSQTCVDSVYVYPKSSKGLCGSVLVSNGNITKPIIGIHIAGVRDGLSGYSELLTYESFSWISDIIISSSLKVDAQMVEEEPKMLPDTNVAFIGVIPRELECAPPKVSRLVHTENAGAITEINMDVPVLSSRDERIKDCPFSPLFEGIRNHGLVPDNFPSLEVYNAYSDLSDQIKAVVVPQRIEVGVLSIEQSIVGIPEIPFYEILDMKTSEGFPFNKVRPPGYTNKSWLFDIDYDHVDGIHLNGVDPLLMDCMTIKSNMRKNGEIPDTVFTACLKDAKLPKDKVLKPGKTRIFSISPVDFTIQQRQYFMDFAVAYQEARFNAEHGIGIDIKSSETTNLVDRLLSNSKYLLTGDYSKFGDQLMSCCVYYAYKIICDWYMYNGDNSIENLKVRMVFCEEIMHAKILAINTIYQNLCGMPSGNSLTVIINSLVNSLYVRVVWQLIMKDVNTDYYPLSVFHLNVVPIFYGDDLIMSVKEEVLELYNVKTMSDKFKEFGIVFTDSSKSVNITPYCNISDSNASFLKHTFHRHPYRYGIWIAKLDYIAAHEICNWTWNTLKDIRESSVVACTSMLEEMFGYGPEYYDKMRQRVIEYWQNKNVVIKIPTWYEMDVRIFGI